MTHVVVVLGNTTVDLFSYKREGKTISLPAKKSLGLLWNGTHKASQKYLRNVTLKTKANMVVKQLREGEYQIQLSGTWVEQWLCQYLEKIFFMSTEVIDQFLAMMHDGVGMV
jgi:phosphopantetheine adenylyltransferase